MKTNPIPSKMSEQEKLKDIEVLSLSLTSALDRLNDDVADVAKGICANLGVIDPPPTNPLYALVSGFIIGMEECTDSLLKLNEQ